MSSDPKHESTRTDTTETTQPEITSDEERELEDENEKRKAEELKQSLKELDGKTKDMLNDSAASVKRNRRRGNNEGEDTSA